MVTGAATTPTDLILADLAAVGYPVGSLDELRQSGVRYREAIPVLLAWLGRASDAKVKQSIVRTLSVPWAKPLATTPLIDAFREVPASIDPTGTGLRWVIGNALEVLFDEAHLEAYLSLAVDTSYGRARQMVVLSLTKSRSPRAVEVLLGLITDPDVDGHAVKALAQLKAPAARSALESKVSDHRAWVRRAARKGLQKLT